MSENYIQYFVDNFEGKDTLLIQNIYRVFGSRKQLLSEYKNEKLSVKSDMNKLIADYKILAKGSPYAKFYNLEIIKSNCIFFKESITFGEDLIFYLDYIKYIEFIKFLPDANYFYYWSPNSAITKKHHPSELLETHLGFFEFMKNHKENEEIINFSNVYLWDSIELILDSLIFKNIPKKERFLYYKKITNVDLDLLKTPSTLNRKIIKNLLNHHFLLDNYQKIKHFIVNKLRLKKLTKK